MSALPSQVQVPCPIAASLAEEKRARKQAEDDALRLYNRVRQLQKEEERAERYTWPVLHRVSQIAGTPLGQHAKVLSR